MTKVQSKVEKLFQIMTDSASILQNKLDLHYFEALVETGENIFQQQIMQELDDITAHRLQKMAQEIQLSQFTKEEIRKAMQLAILKGMKEATQANHEMTPDAVALFIGYLTSKFVSHKESLRVLDPAIGTGNLLTAVLNQLDKNIAAYGVEVDEILIHLAYVNANLQGHEIELFKQDSLQPLLVDPVDIVVCDLPVGYYPNDEVAKEYELHTEEGHSLSHHLFIEKSIKHTRDGGFLIFLIPNFLFVSDEAPKLHTFLKEYAHILGLLQLPLSMFKNERHAKSIFLLQKKGKDIAAPKQALLAEMPSFSKKAAMEDMIKRINAWFTAEIYK